MQLHLELDAAKLHVTVQSRQAMRGGAAVRLQSHQRLAERV